MQLINFIKNRFNPISTYSEDRTALAKSELISVLEKYVKKDEGFQTLIDEVRNSDYNSLVDILKTEYWHQNDDYGYKDLARELRKIYIKLTDDQTSIDDDKDMNINRVHFSKTSESIKLGSYSSVGKVKSLKISDILSKVSRDLLVDEDCKFELREGGYTKFLLNVLKDKGYDLDDEWIEVHFGPTISGMKQDQIMSPYLGSDKIDLANPDYVAIPMYALGPNRFDSVEMMYFLEDGIAIRVHAQGEDQGFHFLMPYAECEDKLR